MVALIVVVVVPVCVLVGCVPFAWLSGRRFGRAKDSFRCKAWVESGLVASLGRKCGRRWMRAAWVHDVLILQPGRVFARVRHLPVRSAEAVCAEGGGTLSVRLRLDDGPLIALRCREADLTRVVGPFLMAELEHLARAGS